MAPPTRPLRSAARVLLRWSGILPVALLLAAAPS